MIPRRRLCLAAFVLFLAAAAQGAVAAAEPWRKAEPAAAGWSVERLEEARAYARTLNPTAVMIVQDGKAVAEWGDVRRKVNVASVRKSLLSALYGIAVAEGRIDLSGTLAELGIDDKPPALTAGEKRATVRDLLMARSGVYHPSAYETGDMKRKRPARGSHAPGTFWFYNNWDFNALGTIYRERTGEDIFDSFARRIARPIGMEDFSAKDGSYVLEAGSVHPAYPFSLSARDAARFGQLFLDGGAWQGRQVVPAAWIRESTAAYSHTRRGNLGYGYLWWVLKPETFGEGAILASGYGGQMIAVVPARRLVVAQTSAPNRGSGRIRTSHFVDLLKLIVAAAP
jgi:CubicO group peptidase (beta-lactamase class C family)